MAGQYVSAVFHTRAALDCRLSQIAQLPRDVCYHGRHGHLPSGNLRIEITEVDDSKYDRADHRSYGAFPAFLGADDGSEPVLSKRSPDVISEAVASPVQGQRKEQPMDAPASQQLSKMPGKNGINGSEEIRCDVREHVSKVLEPKSRYE